MSSKSQYTGLAAGFLSIASIVGAVPAAHAFDFKLSGQVNRAIIAADNGQDQGIGFVDNHSSDTRFGFKGSQDVNPDLSVGFDYVIGLGSNQSNKFDVNKGNAGLGGGSAIQSRQANVYLEGDFGKFTLGRQDGAANSTSKVDLSGLTDLGGGSVVNDYMGGLSFLSSNPGPNGSYSTTSVSSVYSSFDALSRQDAIRYDTPSYNGFTVAASLDQGQAYEFAPRYKTEFSNGTKFEAALDYANSGQQQQTRLPSGERVSGTNDTKFQEYGGSASVLLPFGLNFTAQYKRRNYTDTLYSNGQHADHAQTYFGGVGYRTGKNYVQGFFGQTDDLFTKGSTARNYGVAYRYDLLKSVNMYASYHHLTADNLGLAGGSAQSINVLFTGVRVKFF